MKDDLEETVANGQCAYPSELFVEIGECSQYKITRGRARYAMQQLWLIQWDDSNNEEDIEICGEEQTTGDPDGEDEWEDIDEEEEKEKDKRQCELCQNLPGFPATRRRNFRLVRSKCPHFLAISYCWPKNAVGSPRETPRSYSYYKIFPNGERVAQTNKPPDNVVDRAIEFALSVGLQQLWIDAPCLPQDNSEEHQLGIQAIDLAYQRAAASVGLLGSIISEQRLWDAYESMRLWENFRNAVDKLPAIPTGRHHIAQSLLDFLSLIAEDQYNTRAWTLQEGLCSKPYDSSRKAGTWDRSSGTDGRRYCPRYTLLPTR